MESGQLKSEMIDPNGKYETKSWLERVIIVGLNNEPSKVTIESGSGNRGNLEFNYVKGGPNTANYLVVRKPGINMGETFSIILH